MPAEARAAQLRVVLIIGDTLPAAPAERLRQAGWQSRQADDVYAATVDLLRPGPVRPAAVVVAGESLRGDELRFFDMLDRRWPDLPVAATWRVSSEDRRLEACRRRGVAVVELEAVADWLAGDDLPGNEPAERGALPAEPLGDGPQPTPGPATAEDRTQQEPAQKEPEPAVEMAEDDPAGEEPAAVQSEPVQPTSEAESADPHAAVTLPQQGADDPPPPDDLEREDVPLTPWSAKARVTRRPPRGQNHPAPVAEPPSVPPPAASPSLPSAPAAEPEAARSDACPMQDCLLTPEELKALLQEMNGSDTEGPQA